MQSLKFLYVSHCYLQGYLSSTPSLRPKRSRTVTICPFLPNKYPSPFSLALNHHKLRLLHQHLPQSYPSSPGTAVFNPDMSLQEQLETLECLCHRSHVFLPYHPCTSLHCTDFIALHFIALHCTALHCIAMQCNAIQCITLHCITLHCTALHCTATQ